MKKTILLLATGVLLVTFNANAQIGFGVKAGLNFNSASIDAASGGASASDVASTSTGYHFGVFSSGIGRFGLGSGNDNAGSICRTKRGTSLAERDRCCYGVFKAADAQVISIKTR